MIEWIENNQDFLGFYEQKLIFEIKLGMNFYELKSKNKKIKLPRIYTSRNVETLKSEGEKFVNTNTILIQESIQKISNSEYKRAQLNRNYNKSVNQKEALKIKKRIQNIQKEIETIVSEVQNSNSNPNRIEFMKKVLDDYGNSLQSNIKKLKKLR